MMSRDILGPILDPLAPADLMAAHTARTCVRIAGRVGKFTDLFSWSELNSVLETHRLESPRLRLFKGGQEIASDSYSHQYRFSQHDVVRRLLPAAVEKQIAEGATLVLRAVDEICPQVRELAEALQHQFRARVQVNAYAGCQEQAGLDTHYDDHDVLILQVRGRKRWQLFGLAEHYRGAAYTGRPSPPMIPEEDFVLADGEVLYLPRGYWHLVRPINEPAMHLTFGIHNPLGADLLLLATRRAMRMPQFLTNVPKTDDASVRQSYMRELLEAFVGMWTSERVNDLFADSTSVVERPRFNLPSSSPAVQDVTGSTDTEGARIQPCGSKSLVSR